MTDRINVADSEYGAKDCPRCGTATEIVKSDMELPYRTCPDCIWDVVISGRTTVSAPDD